MSPEEIADRLRTRFSDVLLARGEVTVLVGPGEVVATLETLRDDPELRLDFLSCLTATHHPGVVPALWVVYELRSTVSRHRVRVKAGLAGDDAPHVPSITPMFPTANWQEREVFDFYGIVFDGHPDLTRILMPDEWEGHPLLKTEELGGVDTRYHGAFIPPVDPADSDVSVREDRPSARQMDPSGEIRQETMIINMGPQHPSTHGVLRLVMELDGEYVVRCKPIVGYLHTGIEKNTEYRTWMQGITYVTRADYLAPFFNELGYCLAVERLLGIEAPHRAQMIRVLCNEMNRISSHLLWLATTSLELGAVSIMLYGFREREILMDIFETITGLRMNPAYVRIGGVLMDLPSDGERRIRAFLDEMPGRIDEYETILNDNPIWRERNEGVGRLSAEACLALGVTGPILRAAGVAQDVRRDAPYSGYETYDFDVITRTEADAYARYRIRLEEMRQSLRIIEQCVDRLDEPGPVMVEDPKVRWPAQLSVGPDGIGNDPAYVRHIMEESMEALIHHFKMVTDGVQVPAGEVYQTVESPRGELGFYVVSDGGHRPYRVKIRDPSFVNLQATAAMVEGSLVADAIASIASIDPVMGGVDR